MNNRIVFDFYGNHIYCTDFEICMETEDWEDWSKDGLVRHTREIHLVTPIKKYLLFSQIDDLELSQAMFTTFKSKVADVLLKGNGEPIVNVLETIHEVYEKLGRR